MFLSRHFRPVALKEFVCVLLPSSLITAYRYVNKNVCCRNQQPVADRAAPLSTFLTAISVCVLMVRKSGRDIRFGNNFSSISSLFCSVPKLYVKKTKKHRQHIYISKRNRIEYINHLTLPKLEVWV